MAQMTHRPKQLRPPKTLSKFAPYNLCQVVAGEIKTLGFGFPECYKRLRKLNKVQRGGRR